MTYLEKKYNFDDPMVASAIDELSLWSSYFVQLLLNHIDLRPNTKILDVGFGTGVPLIELAQRVGNSCHITGIEPWKAAIERAQWKQQQHDISNIQIIEGSATKMPFEAESFDQIVSNLTINNINQADLLLKESYRVLKKGGKIYLTTNVVGHYREFYDVYETVLKELGKKELLPALKAQEHHRGTLESTRKLLEDAGFGITKIIKDRFQWRYLDGSALLRHSLTVFGFLEGWRSILEKQDEVLVFSKIEEKLNEIAKEEGELKMSIPMLYLEGMK